MNGRYKAVMFLTLLIFCVGSVCAAEPDNTTGDGGLNPVNPTITNTTDVVKIVNSELEKRDIIIQNQELRIKNLENSSADKDIRINELNKTVNNQSVIINALKDDNKVLTDSNKVLTDRVQALEYSKITQSNRIKSLEIDIQNLDESNKQLVNSNKQLVESNKILINKVDKQDEEIKELNIKLDNQSNEINKLNAEKMNLLSEKVQLLNDKENLYKQLLSSDENRTLLKNELKNKDIQINELNNKINELNNEIEQLKDANNELKALNISYGEAQKSIKWVTNYIKQHNKKPTTVKCGKTTFKIDDYLNLLFVKVGKAGINIFKNEKGRLPNYLTIAGYKVPQKVYKKLFNIK